MPITFTLDVEDHRPGPHAELRFPMVTRQIIDWLGGLGARGTFFIVGEEARRHPDLVADIAAAGHEVALHGLRHVPLAEIDPAKLAEELREGRELLEQLAQVTVTGFRAPQFSLTRACPGAPEAIAEAGFAYSSSVLPNASPLFGFPGAPAGPFSWPSGLIELPVTLLGAGKARVPLGGLYFRSLPLGLTKKLLLAADQTVQWLYLHPYDFDPGEKMYVVRDANPIFSPLQWLNRSKVRERVEALFAGAPGLPLGERVRQLATLSVYAG